MALKPTKCSVTPISEIFLLVCNSAMTLLESFDCGEMEHRTSLGKEGEKRIALFEDKGASKGCLKSVVVPDY